MVADIGAVVLAGRTDEQKAACIVMAVVVEERRAAGVEIGIEALTIVTGPSIGGLVQLYQTVVRAPLPDACIIAGRAAARITHDIMFDERAIGAPWYDAVAAHIFHIIVTDDDLFAGKPVGGCYLIADPGYAGSIDAPDDVAFNDEVVETGRQLLPCGAEDYAAIILSVVGPAYIVNVHVPNTDTARDAAILGRYEKAGAVGGKGAVVRDFEAADRHIICIDDADGMGRNAACINARTGTCSVRSDGDGGLFTSGTGER